MPQIKDCKDAFGLALLEHHLGEGQAIVIERDDGYVDVDFDPRSSYLSPPSRWPLRQRRALRLAKGKVLDIGCGAGRHGIHLQGNGHEVVGIDESPRAIQTCRLRGLKKAKVLSIARIGPQLGTFDTVIMLGNNFGLFGSAAGARRLLRQLHKMTSADARIIAEVLDPYRTDNSLHLQYHKSNRRRGRMSGQLRIRVRYKIHTTPWFDYLFVSPKEMERIVSGTGWRIAKTIDPTCPVYVAVIVKT